MGVAERSAGMSDNPFQGINLVAGVRRKRGDYPFRKELKGLISIEGIPTSA